MQDEVTQRFLKSVNHLKSLKKVKSTRQFALSIDLHPQCMSDISTGKRPVNNEILSKTIEKYSINPSYLFLGHGAILMNGESGNISEPILTVVTDKDGVEKIVYVPIAAQAGYGGQLHDPIYVQDLPTFSLPDNRFAHGSYRCFDVAGDSMEPTLYNGDKVVCNFIEKENWFHGIREKYVYVIIQRDSVLIKRVANNLKTKGTLTLISDNSFWDPVDLELKDIVEVWQVAVKISPFMSSPQNVRNGLHTEIDVLKQTISDQSLLIKSLNATVEKLLKQNRTKIIR